MIYESICGDVDQDKVHSSRNVRKKTNLKSWQVYLKDVPLEPVLQF